MDNDLDRILSSDQDMIPSSQFVRNVMVAVHREASLSPPIPFPWRHVLPGLSICVAALASLIVVVIIHVGKGSPATGPEPVILLNLVRIANRVQAGWVLLALVASYIPTKLALALRGRNIIP